MSEMETWGKMLIIPCLRSGAGPWVSIACLLQDTSHLYPEIPSAQTSYHYIFSSHNWKGQYKAKHCCQDLPRGPCNFKLKTTGNKTEHPKGHLAHSPGRVVVFHWRKNAPTYTIPLLRSKNYLPLKCTRTECCELLGILIGTQGKSHHHNRLCTSL